MKKLEKTPIRICEFKFDFLILGEGFLTNSYFPIGITEKNLRKINLGIVTKHTSVHQTNSVGL
jgi:hypothetical protein